MECNRVLQSGPWLFDGRLVILKQWTADIGLERDLLSSIPVWIRFPSLHLKYWSQSIMSMPDSLVGVPLFMDKATTFLERIAYASCFVGYLLMLLKRNLFGWKWGERRRPR